VAVFGVVVFDVVAAVLDALAVVAGFVLFVPAAGVVWA
jgi:hypothetical protein